MAAPRNNLAVQLLIDAQDRASKVFEALTGRVAQLGAALATYLSARAAGGFLGDSVEKAADLEQKLSILQQTSGATAAELAQLKVAAEAVADSPLPYTASQAAAAEIELARAGQSATQVIASLPPVLSLAAAGQIEVADAAGIVTAQLGAFGLEAEQSARVADVLVAGANASNTSVQGLAAALSYAGPLAKAAGVSIEQASAAIGVMANAGIDGERAGTALNSILSQLQDPASKASQALSAMGVTSRDLSSVLQALAADTPMANSAILAFGTEAGPGLRAMLGAGGRAVDELATKISGMRGAAGDAAAAMQSNLLGAFGELGKLWDTIKARIGEGLLEPLTREIRQVSGDLRGWINSGQLEKLRDALSAAFVAAAKAARDFVAGLDLSALVQRISAFVSTTGTTLTQWGQKLSELSDIAARMVAGISAAFNGFVGAVNTVGQALAGIIANVLNAYASLVAAAQKVGIAEQETALKAKAAAETAKEAWAAYAAAAGQHYQAAGEAWDRLVAKQTDGAAQVATVAAQATEAARVQGDTAGITADQLDRLGAGANFAAAGQQTLSAATQSLTQQQAMLLEQERDLIDTSAQRAASTEKTAQALQQEVNQRQLAIAAAQTELEIKGRAVGLIDAEGRVRVTHLENLRAEALARGDTAAAARLDAQATDESIRVAQAAVEAKRAEAAAAEEFARLLEEEARLRGDVSTETRGQIVAAQQSAQSKQLEAQATQEAYRHEVALRAATEATAAATARSAAAAEQDAAARERSAAAESDMANFTSGAASAWAAYWSPENIAKQVDSMTGGDTSIRSMILGRLLNSMTKGGTGDTIGFIRDKSAAVHAVWDQQTATTTRQTATQQPATQAVKTVQVNLTLGGKTTKVNVLEGQETDLLDAIRRAGLAA